MTKPTNRKKRSKLTIFLLAPILAIVFVAGWSLYWIGQSKQPQTKQLQKTTNKTSTNHNDIELIMIPKQEEQILTN